MFGKFTLILIIICMALGIGLLISVSTCNKKQKQIKVATNVSKHINDSTTHKVDKEGTVHANKIVIDVDDKSLELFYKEKADKLAYKLNLALKQISVMSDAHLQASDDFFSKARPDTIYLPDSTRLSVNCFDYYDTFTHIYACIEKNEGKVDSLTSYCQYRVDVPMNLTVYWRRKHKFLFLRYGKKIDSTDIYSDNPNVQISDLNYIRIKQ